MSSQRDERLAAEAEKAKAIRAAAERRRLEPTLPEMMPDARARQHARNVGLDNKSTTHRRGGGPRGATSL